MIQKEFIASSCSSLEGSSITRHYVRGIVFQENKLLMLYSQIHKDYSFPGGGVESEETNFEAISREMMEECGTDVISIGLPFAQITEIDPAAEPEIDLFIRKGLYFPCRISDRFVEPWLSQSEMFRRNSIVWIGADEALYYNQRLMKNSDSPPPRWVRRETFILEQLVQNHGSHTGDRLD